MTMRILSALLLSATIAAPAAAQQRAPAPAETAEIQRALTDPAITDKLTRVLPALGVALLKLPVGEIEAAMEGRPATRADKRKTVGDLGRREDPNFERNLKADLANSGETMKAGMKAMSTALPVMMEGMRKAAEEMEKAMANLPSPAYPRR
jgi:hypothetical protein